MDKSVLIKTLAALGAVNLALTSAISTADDSVQTTSLSEIAVYPQRSAPASVISLNESDISAENSALISAIPVRVGDIVDRGTVLVELDCADYVLARRRAGANLKAIESKLAFAQKHLQRTRQLVLKQSIAEELVDERESSYMTLQAELQGAKIEVEKSRLDESRCKVRSPFQALVTARNSAVGEFVMSGTTLVRVVDVNNIEVSATVIDRDLEHIRNAAELYFERDGTRRSLSMRAAVQAIDAATGSRELRLVFTGERALPGSTGKLIWLDARPHLPARLLVERDGKLGVFTVEHNTAKFNVVPDAQTGRSNMTALDLSSELVVEGHFSLQDNMPVNVAR